MGVDHMRVQITRSANAECFYIVKSIRKNGRNTNKVVERLGNIDEVRVKAGGKDPYLWAEEYAKRLTEEEKEQTRQILVPFSQSKMIPKDHIHQFNGGYLFLQKIYYDLRLKDICKAIKRKHQFDYDLNSILSRLVYCRIIHPTSKCSTYEYSQQLLEKPSFDLHQIYRALDVLAEESDYIQEKLYRYSQGVVERNTDVLYYDCTNYFFEIEEEKGMRKYGAGKDGKPLPLVEMGLLMDGNGIPLSFCIHDGNTNEQVTLKPLEEKIIADFNLSKFIICTDAGLSSGNNKFFNAMNDREFITATSVKKLEEQRRTRLLQPSGWKLSGSSDGKFYDLDELGNDEKTRKAYYDKTFFKEEWFVDQVDVYDEGLKKKVKRDLPQRLIITFSFKYANYMKNLRDQKLERARKLIVQGDSAIRHKGKHDVREFIQEVSYTSDGEVAESRAYAIDETAVLEDSLYDGFYAVYTSLDQEAYPAHLINEISHNRWEIEECFRIMKSEFKARPVFLQKDNRIKAHFMTCFIALLILRILEYRLDQRFTYPEIIDTISNMNFCQLNENGFIPTYTRTDLTDALHDSFGFRTDYEILSHATMKNIFTLTKKA